MTMIMCMVRTLIIIISMRLIAILNTASHMILITIILVMIMIAIMIEHIQDDCYADDGASNCDSVDGSHSDHDYNYDCDEDYDDDYEYGHVYVFYVYNASLPPHNNNCGGITITTIMCATGMSPHLPNHRSATPPSEKRLGRVAMSHMCVGETPAPQSRCGHDLPPPLPPPKKTTSYASFAI